MAIQIESEEAFDEMASALSQLRNSDPLIAVERVRQLRGRGALKIPVLSLRGAILIDAGNDLGDREAVIEGIGVFRKLIKDKNNPAHLTFRYNLANGLSTITELTEIKDAAWYVTTTAYRRESRRLFKEVYEEQHDPVEKARACINLGNSLDSGFRWVEAYDQWVRALQIDPSNQVGALSIARMLLRRMRQDVFHTPSLHRVTGYYARLARRNASTIGRNAGPVGMDLAKSLPTFQSSSWRPRKLHQIRDEFGRFLAQHRLALVGTVEGLDLRKKRWDDVHIPSVSESLDSGAGVPGVFAMFNQLKADFCAARWLAFLWDHNPPRDNSLYMDTLDYACYGVAPSLLALAQRSAIEILDRIAVCANEYFEIGVQPSRINFRKFWRERNGVGEWRSVLGGELKNWNPGIIALGELASDLSEGGCLAIHRSLRNAGTHRCLVLHDLGCHPSRESRAVDHFELDWFRDQVIDTLRIARSAILYLRDAIMAREARRKAKRGMKIQLVSHHHIRGED